MIGAGAPQTVSALLRRNRERFGEREALTFRATPSSSLQWTFADLDARADQVARAAIEAGWNPGDRVVVWCTNHPDWIALQYGLARAGVVLVTANTALKRDEITYILSRSKARALFFGAGMKDHPFPPIVGALERTTLRDLTQTIAVADADGDAAGSISLRAFLDHGDSIGDAVVRDREAALDPDDVINMQYTSGTTGFPKGVMLSHANILGNGHALADALGYTPLDRLCLCVPLFHCFGCVAGTLAAHTAAVPIALCEAFQADLVLDTIERERCTALYGVPTMFTALLEKQRAAPRDLSSLRVGLMAGATCPPALMRAAISELPLPGLVVSYGLTEASPAITASRPDDPLESRATTVGRPLPGVSVRIVHPMTGVDVRPGVEGELWSRGPNTMKGYDGDEVATRAVLTRDGWLRTGDLAVETTSGAYRVTGRIKELIIRGGENIAPAEVEDALRRHPSVADAAVFAIASDFFGEEVAAAVRLKDGVDAGDADEGSLRAFVRGLLADHKVPIRILFQSAFPLTASGKVQRFQLRRMAEESTDR